MKAIRKKGLLVFLTDEEREYLARVAYGTGYSRATIIRLRTFRPGWKQELEKIRAQQAKIPAEVLRGGH